ncbi:sorting nexin-16-like isoform X1 [Dermacentor silvarum]|uniref:sorting nexin-16-like isoform X1 n=1 Tax=Dermacentor silvarum TaxID=543639 RepID=UPI00189997D6|nr:sorting nexin-16-like isoform X1 [Dermacentor silvarum]XP_049512078.1 sorting nexin-16-like isoform X1 [Dermacentor silvarum]
MSSEAETAQQSATADGLDTDNCATSKCEPVPPQGAAHEMSRYPFSKQDRESLSSVSSDSGDVSNGHCCDIEEEGIVVIPEYNTPIIGYEVMEERARFTVFKIRVEHVETGRYWFVFRRYTDFARLSKKLKPRFPGLQLCLPPKRWFGNNFDPMFLEDRVLGLQAFVKNIMGHRDISKSPPVREFFCLDDPPEPLDTIEESRALCENLEEQVYRLNQQLRERDAEIEVLRSELDSLRLQHGVLVKALKLECSLASWANAQLSRDRPQLPSSHAFGLHALNLTLSSMADGSKEVAGNQDPESCPATPEAGGGGDAR